MEARLILEDLGTQSPYISTQQDFPLIIPFSFCFALVVYLFSDVKYS